MTHFNESITVSRLNSLDPQIWKCDRPTSQYDTHAGLNFDFRSTVCKAKPYGDGFELVLVHMNFTTNGTLNSSSQRDEIESARLKMAEEATDSAVGLHPMVGLYVWPRSDGERNASYGMLRGMSTYSQTTGIWTDIEYDDFNLNGQLDHGDMITVSEYSSGTRPVAGTRPIDSQELVNLNGQWVDWITGGPIKDEYRPAVDIVRVNYSAMWRAAGLSRK